MHWLHVTDSITYHVFIATGLRMSVEPPGGYQWLMRKLSNMRILIRRISLIHEVSLAVAYTGFTAKLFKSHTHAHGPAHI